MASIYDIARIKAGDPMGLASEGAREASSALERYKNQKEKIDEINRAIEEAKRKASKNKLGYGLLGSLIGAGLGGLTGGIPTPWLQKLASGAVSALASGGAEKYRQDRLGATDKLKALEKKHKGTRLAKDIRGTRKVFEKAQDEMLQGDIMSNVMADLIAPVKEGFKLTDKATGEKWNLRDLLLSNELTPSSIPSHPSGQPINRYKPWELENLISVEEGPSLGSLPKLVGFEFPSITKPSVGVNISPKGARVNVKGPQVKGSLGQWTKGQAPSLGKYNVNLPNVNLPKVNLAKRGIDQKYLGGFFPKLFGAEGVFSNMPKEFADDMKKYNTPLMAGLLRTLGPTAYAAATMPKPYVEQYERPQFRNPYRGGF